MDFGTWIGQAEAPEAAILTGGNEAMFEMIATNRFPRQTRILCTDELASEITLRASAADKQVPELLISRGLRRDLADFAVGMAEIATFIPNPMIRDYVDTETRRVGAEADLVSGYPTPADLLFAAVLADLSDRFAHAARRSKAVLVIHDRDGDLVRRDAKFCRTFSMPTGELSEIESAEIEAPAAADPEDVTQSKLREQVDFILSTDEDALKAIHSTIGRPAKSAIHAIWLGNLRGTSGDSDFDERAKSAANKLEDMLAHTAA